MSADFIKRISGIKEPRYMLAGDIGHWETLRGQINAKTGRINSYRDIRKIVASEGRTVPSLGTLRNYLGEGGITRKGRAQAEWKVWFEEFGTITEFFKDELDYLSDVKQWEEFREVYTLFMGY